MKNIWVNFSSRERLLLSAMAALICVIVFSVTIVRPVTEYKKNAYVALARAERIAGLVARSEVGAKSTEDDDEDTLNLRSTVTNSARQAQLRWVNIRSDAQSQSLTVTFSQVELGQLFEWLIALQDRQNILVESGNISGSNESAGVEATITLARGD